MPGYRGRNAPSKVCTTGQKRRLTHIANSNGGPPSIGHLKEHHRMGRNYLAHASGDAINAVLAAAGYNFRRLLVWLRFLLLGIRIILGRAAQPKSRPTK
jgi:transposase, IS5 family